MSFASLALFTLGWSCGWVLLWRLPRLRVPPTVQARRSLAVIVPARDEAHNVVALVDSLRPQLGPSDELVVVDDHSSDGTGAMAVSAGAKVVVAPALPAGWAGKPWACDTGTRATTGEVLVFVDADVTLAAGALASLEAEQRRTGGLVSVQPWHRIERPYETLSMLFNVTALMGGGGFSIVRRRVRQRLAYGPVLVVDRACYEAAGGHAHPEVRGAVAEDLALGRRIGRNVAFAGRAIATFRMYPAGVRSLVQGWTKNIATGARSVPWWVAPLMVGWIWSLAGGVFTSWWCYLASALQLLVQGRRVGRFGALTAAVYPALLVFFLVVFVRSAVLTVLGRPVLWRGRRVPTRAPG